MRQLARRIHRAHHAHGRRTPRIAQRIAVVDREIVRAAGGHRARVERSSHAAAGHRHGLQPIAQRSAQCAERSVATTVRLVRDRAQLIKKPGLQSPLLHHARALRPARAERVGVRPHLCSRRDVGEPYVTAQGLHARPLDVSGNRDGNRRHHVDRPAEADQPSKQAGGFHVRVSRYGRNWISSSVCPGAACWRLFQMKPSAGSTQ